MPELPEIEVLKDQINKALSNRRITKVEVFDQKVVNLSVEDFKGGLLDRELLLAERRGKMLILRLSRRVILLIHLMLFGKIRIIREAQGQLAIGFNNNIWLTFSHLALGAFVHLYHKEIDEIPRVARLGVDALEISRDELKKMVLSRRGKIKSILMDQELIAGIGNTYADELLFRARVHPERIAKSLREEEIDSIYKEIRVVLREAISKGGGLTDDFSHLDGSKGEYIPKIHKCEGDPCPFCKAEIRKTVVNGRGTNYCPRCQV